MVIFQKKDMIMIITDKALKDYEECQKNAGELADASGRADDALMDIAIALLEDLMEKKGYTIDQVYEIAEVLEC